MFFFEKDCKRDKIFDSDFSMFMCYFDMGLEGAGLGLETFKVFEVRFLVDVEDNDDKVGFLRLLSLVSLIEFLNTSDSPNLLLF